LYFQTESAEVSEESTSATKNDVTPVVMDEKGDHEQNTEANADNLSVEPLETAKTNNGNEIDNLTERVHTEGQKSTVSEGIAC